MEFLIDLQTLKHYSLIDANVNDEVLRVILKRVQDIYIHPVLGTPLYKRFLEGVENDDLTADELKLLNDYILNYLYVVCDIQASTHLNWRIRNKSVGSASDEHVRANNVPDTNNLVDNLRKQASFYKNRLIGYLKDNDTLFPLYCSSDYYSKEEIKPDNQGTSYNISFI